MIPEAVIITGEVKEKDENVYSNEDDDDDDIVSYEKEFLSLNQWLKKAKLFVIGLIFFLLITTTAWILEKFLTAFYRVTEWSNFHSLICSGIAKISSQCAEWTDKLQPNFFFAVRREFMHELTKDISFSWSTLFLTILLVGSIYKSFYLCKKIKTKRAQRNFRKKHHYGKY
jgi:cbb3-type cytochrome oxidase subunit 3